VGIKGGKTSLSLLLVTASLLVLLVLTSSAGALTRINSTSSTTTLASSSQPLPPSQAGEGGSNGPDAGCNSTISLDGTALVARGVSGSETGESAGTDLGAFLNTLLASHETFCLEAGSYTVSTAIHINHLQGVTLNLDSGAVMKASSRSRVLDVDGSPGTVVRGGEWIGLGAGQASVIRIEHGSNNTVVEHADISEGGWDGILIYQTNGPSFNVSILDNFLHDNGRYGAQEYSDGSVGMWRTIISGNFALNNKVGGIYTNGAADVTIIQNVVRNTAGNGPGEIGIGVTNGYNDTVTQNQVDHMAWFGIQAYYNNYTVISDNISTFNAGGWDQSGITNDHSSYSTIVGNVVESNGRFGIYVERSWGVTVKGNLANENYGYGIGFYHGTLPTMGRGVIFGNICSSNSAGGIILSSAINNVISMNQCNDNSGDGILLYNDPGQLGSTGNLISTNWLGNLGNLPPTQMFGIREANDANNNTLTSNMMVGNTEAAISILGPDTTVSP
jgi:parallel beta-helix repeat protein